MKGKYKMDNNVIGDVEFEIKEIEKLANDDEMEKQNMTIGGSWMTVVCC